MSEALQGERQVDNKELVTVLFLQAELSFFNYLEASESKRHCLKATKTTTILISMRMINNTQGSYQLTIQQHHTSPRHAQVPSSRVFYLAARPN